MNPRRIARGIAWAAAAGAVAAEIPYPLLSGATRRGLTVAAVLVFALACLAQAWHEGGPRRAAGVGGATAGVGWLIEVLGVHTGVPFGHYRYGAGLGAKLAGVPVLVPVAWTMVCYPSFLAARRLSRRPAMIAMLTALAAAGWDLFLDPQLVAADSWHWSGPQPTWPGSGGVPVSNFGGWLLAGLVVAAALIAVCGPEPGSDTSVVLLFGWAYLSGLLANLAFFARPWVALYGGLGMGLVALPLLARPLLARPLRAEGW